jgi:hypothetical protein
MIASASFALKAAANWASSALILASSLAAWAVAAGVPRAAVASKANAAAIRIFMIRPRSRSFDPLAAAAIGIHNSADDNRSEAPGQP